MPSHTVADECRRTQPALYEVGSDKPENVAEQNPEEFARLSALARGLHETARVMLYSNKIEK